MEKTAQDRAEWREVAYMFLCKQSTSEVISPAHNIKCV